MTLNELLNRLQGVKQTGENQYAAHCPNSNRHKHNDSTPSLSVSSDTKTGKILLCCQTGCSIEEICSAIGCSVSDLMGNGTHNRDVRSLCGWYADQQGLKLIDIYDYRDGLYKARFIDNNGKKTFRWIHKDSAEKSGFKMNRQNVRPRLYVSGSLDDSDIFIAEGEKDADTLHRITGRAAACSENGAGKQSGKKWADEYNQQIKGKRVFLLWDNDDVGKEFAQMEIEQMKSHASQIIPIDIVSFWPECPEKGDISDAVEKLGEDEVKERLRSVISNTQPILCSQDREEKQSEQKKKRSAALANLGIEDSDSLNIRYDHAGSIAEVIDIKTGEIIYHNPDAFVPDPVQPIPGKTIFTISGENEPSSAEEPKLIVSGFDDVEIKPTDYLFFPWFPRGKLVQIQGDTSSSKSTFMYAVGAVVSTGTNLLTVPCEDPGNVMFITIEDDESDIKIAFQDAGGDIGHLRRIQDREEIAKLSLSPAGAQMIDRIIKEENIKLLVLDPIQQFINGDMNKANDTRPQLARLMNIAAENNICIVFLAHMGKDTSKSALHRGIGSVDIGAATRSIIQIVTDPEDDFFKIAFSVKNNTADFHDVQRAIRYQVKDHPGSYNPETKQRARYHGHAEFSEILPEYNERLYRKAVRKADEAEEAEEALLFEYDDDPLVITARQLIAENPQGLFIGTDDLIQKITQCAGRCPYEQTKSKVNGIYSRVSKLRKMMIDSDGIQADIQSGPQQAKAYNWRGSIFQPQRTGKTRGIFLTPVKNGTGGSQQTKI